MKYTIEEINKLQERLDKLIDSNIRNMDFYNWEPDSSPTAWEYYISTYIKFDLSQWIGYKDNYLKSFTRGQKNYPYTKADTNRICCSFQYEKNNLVADNYKDKKPTIKLAGDCCFNFNDNKIKKFNRLTENDEAIKNFLEKIKETLHHSPLNFALMPINGGMNNVKGDGIQGLDRFDTFISALYLYFENKENPIVIKLIAEFETSQNSLVPFLKSIGSFENYLELFYPELLEDDRKEYNDKKKLLDRLIESGKNPINSEDRVLEYIELAIRFWEAKLDYYYKQKLLQTKPA